MVLTTVPQATMPVLAAEEGIEAEAETAPEAVEEDSAAPADDNEDSAAADAETPDVSGDSDATEGEQDESTEGDSETPVINEGENADGDQTTEEPAEEDDASDAKTDSADLNAEAAAKPAKPVITIKNGGSKVEDLTEALPNRAEGITFEIAAVTGVTFKYTVDGSAPTKDTETTYSNPVAVTAPNQDAAGEVKIQAIAVVTPESGEAQVSEVETVTVKFAEKPAPKTITLSEDSDDNVHVNVNDEATLTKTTPYSITNPENGVYVTVAGDSSDALFEVMYLGEDKEAEWTSVYADNEGRYRLPDDKLGEKLQLKVLVMKKITLVWEGASWNSVGISASANREEKGPDEIVFGDQLKKQLGDAYANKIYAPKGTKVKMTVSPLSGQMKLAEVALQKGAGAAEPKDIDETGAAEFVVADEIADDYTLTIKGTAGYQRVVLTDGWEEVKPDSKKNYNVTPTYGTYSYDLTAEDANGKALAVSSVKVSENDAATDTVTVTSNKDRTVWMLDIKETAAKKTLQVGIYDGETCLDTITLKVAPVVETVKIAGEKDKTIKQEIGTVAKYALTPNDKMLPYNLFAYIETEDNSKPNGNSSVASVDVIDGSLVVKTRADVEGKADAAKIVIENYLTDKPVASVTLETLKPAWVSGKPTLKQAGATDTSLTVAVTAPKGFTVPDDEMGGVCFYKVDIKEKKTGSALPTEYVAVTGQTDTYTFKVRPEESGKGAQADYEVTAQLFLYKNSDKTGEIAKSNVSAALKHSTRKPFYADKITLKKEKAASGLYTGQKAAVATVDFGKSASYNSDADVEVVDNYPTDVFENVYIDANLKVWAKAYTYAKPGKYTITVRTTYNKAADSAGDSIVQATASVPVTVVRGIYDIKAAAPTQIYKADNKAVTAKIAVIYNEGDKTYAPKTKKVRYDLVVWPGENEPQKVPGITVTNGTIKIDKDYKADGNEIYIRVKADDYADNETADWVTFTVTGSATSLGKVAVVEEVSGGYKDLAPDDGTEIPINKLNDYYTRVIVVKPGVSKVGGKYLASDVIPTELYTLTAAKGTAVGDDDGDSYGVTADKLGKNLQFKAVPVDGSDKKGVTSNKFTIIADDHVKAEEANVTYEIQGYIDWDQDVLNKNGENKLDVPAGTMIRLSVADRDGYPLYYDEYQSSGSVYDYVLSTTNAKVVKKYENGLALDVIVTKNPAVVTLKKGKNTVGTYNIRIPDLDDTAVVAAPKISLKKGTTIYPIRTQQTLSFTMNKPVEGARYVRISYQDNLDDTKNLSYSIGDTEAVLNSNTQEFAFDVVLDNYDGGAYELKKGASLAFVFLDRDGKVLTKTSNTVKVKTTALKKSYKLDAKYTMSTKDAFRVPFTGKGSGVEDVVFTKLYNANIKGQINKFRTGFKLTDDGKLELREENGVAVAESWTGRDDKNNFTGFVEYKVKYVDGDTADFVSKIQVTLKTANSKKPELGVAAAKKYAATAVSVLNPGANETTEGATYVTVSKLPVDIRAAKVIYDANAKEEDKGVEVKKVSGNEITFTVKGVAAKTKTYSKFKVYVIPLTGMYADNYDYFNWNDLSSKNDVNWRKYGVELKCNVSLKAASSKGKIKSPAKSVSFMNVDPKKLAVDGRSKMYYYAELPYTVGTFATIDDKNITWESKQTRNDPAAFSELKEFKVRKVSNKNALGIYIDAEEFKVRAANSPEWSGATFKKIEMKVPFVGEGTAEEKITFSLTTPNPWSAMSPNEGNLMKIIAVINGMGIKIDGIADSTYQPEYRTLLVTANDGSKEIEAAVNDKKGAMADKLLTDAQIAEWVKRLDSISVTTDLNASTGAGHKVSKKDKTDKEFLIAVIDAYMQDVIDKLQKEGYTTPTWQNLADSKHRTLRVKITAVSIGNREENEVCNVQFMVDESIETGTDLDSAIARAVKRLSDGKVIKSITGDYDSYNKVVTITGSNPELNFIDAKNQGRDKTVQILLSELGDYMDDVAQLTFSYEGTDGTEKFVTVRREDGQPAEQYIADLVDDKTDQLVKKLIEIGYEGDSDPNSFGRLGGKTLSVEAEFNDKEANPNIKYQICFVCEAKPTGLDAAISSAIGKLNERLAKGLIPGVAVINYDNSSRNISIIGKDETVDIVESKNAGKAETVRILLNEMDEYMDEVSEVTFTYEKEDGSELFVTCKKENHESNETYVSDLVDTWTKKLAAELKSQGKETTYASLDGESVEVQVKYQNTQKKPRTYTMSFSVQ